MTSYGAATTRFATLFAYGNRHTTLPHGSRQVAPSLLKGSLFFSLSRRRPMLPAEAMLLQGFPVPSLLPNDCELASLYPFQRPLEEIPPDRTVRNLAGNGMHLCQVGSAFLIAVGLAVEHRRKPDDGSGAKHRTLAM